MRILTQKTEGFVLIFLYAHRTYSHINLKEHLNGFKLNIEFYIFYLVGESVIFSYLCVVAESYFTITNAIRFDWLANSLFLSKISANLQLFAKISMTNLGFQNGIKRLKDKIIRII